MSDVAEVTTSSLGIEQSPSPTSSPFPLPTSTPAAEISEGQADKELKRMCLRLGGQLAILIAANDGTLADFAQRSQLTEYQVGEIAKGEFSGLTLDQMMRVARLLGAQFVFGLQAQAPGPQRR